MVVDLYKCKRLSLERAQVLMTCECVAAGDQTDSWFVAMYLAKTSPRVIQGFLTNGNMRVHHA
jgi:hypothetical protein